MMLFSFSSLFIIILKSIEFINIIEKISNFLVSHGKKCYIDIKEIRMEEQVKEYIEHVRPSLQADGGDVEFVKMEGNVAYVRLQGSCHGCPMAQMTLKNGIEKYLKDNIPGLEAVESV